MSQVTEPAAIAAPPGVTPNFLNPPSAQNTNIICQAACLSLSTIVVWLRLYTRIRITRSLVLADYLCAFAWAGLIVYGIVLLDTNKYGSGIDEWNVSKSHAPRWRLLFNVDEIIYGPIILATKTSILLLYSTLFSPIRRSKLHFFIYSVLWFNVLFYTAITLVKIFACTPRSKIWDRSIPGRCINLHSLLYTTGIVNVTSDIAILVLPIGSVSRLQMATTRKVAICAVFAAGLFAPVASGVRLAKTIKNVGNDNATYFMLPVLLWAEAEVTACIVCSCLPILPVLFRHIFVPTPTTFGGRPEKQSKPSIKHSKSLIFSLKETKSMTQYIGADDSRLLRSEYMELGDMQHRNRSECTTDGPQTTIEGGVHLVNTPHVNLPGIDHFWFR